jgi:2-keto-4-pentenoate hydratase
VASRGTEGLAPAHANAVVCLPPQARWHASGGADDMDHQAAIAHLLPARRGPAVIAPPAESGLAIELDEAYAVQRSLEGALVAAGERVIGWKVGFTTALLQRNYGVSEPVAGFMLASGVYSSGDEVPAKRFAGLALEVEVAFLLRGELAGPGVTVASALLAVEGAMPAFELVDFRMSGKPKGGDVIADGVFANAIVLGRPLTAVGGLDLALEGVVLEHNGERVATATCAEVLGNPLVSLAWLANHLGRAGRSLRPGDVVLTGSIAKVLRPVAGDSVRAAFTRLGSVSCRFV